MGQFIILDLFRWLKSTVELKEGSRRGMLVLELKHAMREAGFWDFVIVKQLILIVKMQINRTQIFIVYSAKS